MPILAAGDLAAAALVLVLVLAGFVIVEVEKHVIPDWGIGGFNLRNAFVDVTTAGLAPLKTALRYLLRPLAWLVGGSFVLAWRLIGHGFNVIEAVPGKIASAYHSALGFATNVYVNATTWASDLFAQAEADITAGVQRADSFATGVWQSATTWASDLFARAEADIVAALASADAFATGVWTTATTWATDLFKSAESDIAAARVEAQSLFTTAEGDLARVWAGVGSDIASAVRAAEGYAGTVADAADAAAAAAAAGVLAEVLPMVTSITTEVDQCLKPLCDSVTPNAGQLGNLGKYLKALEGFATDGAMLAFVLWLLEHQHEAAQDVSAVVTDLAKPVATAVGAVL